MSFPTSTPSYAGFVASHTLAQDSHAAQHNQEQADIIALSNKVGTGSSIPAANTALVSTGLGISGWAKVDLTTTVTGVLPTTNGGTGSSSASTGSGGVVLNSSPSISSPTLTTPTIASFVNANHDHTSSASGGSLGTNAVATSMIQDDAVTAAKVDWATTGASGGIWWEEIGRTTLGSAADTITVSSLPARKYLSVFISVLQTVGAVNRRIRFNGDTGSNYNTTYNVISNSVNTPNSQTADTSGITGTGAAQSSFTHLDIVNTSSKLKMFNGLTLQTDETVSSATTSAITVSFAGVWNNTNQINQIDVINLSAGDFATGSEIVVLGHD